MAYHDRDYNREPYDERPGAASRILLAAEGFFNWAFLIFRVPRSVPGIHGIAVRVHILFLLVLAGEAVAAAQRGYFRPVPFAALAVSSFLLVLLHEFGHCLACRVVGGEADRILMWPLGGLASCNPPHRWKPALITTAGGPGVNLVLMPVFGAILLAAGAEWSEIVYNPFNPVAPAMHVYYDQGWRPWLWALHITNTSLFFFNMCLPMYPMDCGRIIQELLWARIGYRRSMEISVRIGFVAAVCVGVFGLVSGNSRLTALAIFAGMTCYNERQRLQHYREDPWDSDDSPYARSAMNRFDEKPAKQSWFARRAAKSAEKRAQRQAAAQDALNAEVDRILAKIKAEGMGALTAGERKTLESARDR